MKKLSELYDGMDDRVIKGIKINSKEVEEGDIFVCTMGVTADRHLFMDEAISNGASAIVVSKEVGKKPVPVIFVPDTNEELKLLSRKFYDYPDRKLSLIGITGTNGKTTVAEIIYHILGSQCAYLGTNGKKCYAYQEKIRNTTPDADRLYQYMDEFVQKGCNTLAMEASSEAFYRHRLDLIEYDISILTNITQDHMNIHKTLENYIDCKCELFKKTKKDGVAILNSTDTYYEKVKSCCHCQVLTYGFQKSDTLRIHDVMEKKDGLSFKMTYKEEDYLIESNLLGSFNALNLAAAILAALVKKVPIDVIQQKIKQMKPIEGRMESLEFGQSYSIFLDYAHTPDALLKVLRYLNQVKKGRVITVTGSAGGREKEKRPLMGKTVLENSDFVIFTMDDPREEDVDHIIDDLVKDTHKTNYIRVQNRSEAIQKALDMAQNEDIVFIAGKGRDNYMAIGKDYVPYCDYDVVQEYFKKKGRK